jgi:chromosome segregation ATPase
MDTKQLQLENETLNARLDKAKEVFRQQAKDIKAKDEAYLKLRDEYNEVVRERDIHIEANAKFNKQILEAEVLIKELKESQEKQQELADASYDREAYVGQIDGLNDKIDELTEAVKYWEERYHKLSEAHLIENTELTNLKVKNDELTTQLEALDSKHTTEYNALVLRYDDLQKEYNLLNEQFYDLENEYSNSEELRKSYTDATNKLNEEVIRLQDIIVSKDAAYKNLESTYNDFAVEHTRDVNALKYTIEQLKKDLEDKDAKLVDACAKVGRLTKQLEDESCKVEEAKTKTEEAVTTIKKKLQALNDGLGDEFNIFG